ncbi:molecular chaperone [Sphingomonas sp.]|uniref:fimbrial biogenesis chaperone n=1 Tax=Sphingomonas sp. TaxID=28214 RepID=UPI0025D90788|nr:molecular chaperone [Sphingomonas sp.]
MLKIQRSAIALALTSFAQPVLAAGDLLVAPTRVILDGGRGTEVILNNVGAETATYRVSLELRRMTANGQLDEVPTEAATPREKATLAMISYAPRRVVLPPNQPQAIRIGARFAADLPDGEYRAHMLFRAIPDAKAVTATPVREGLSIALTPIYGVTIPIIVRKGALKASAAISDVRMTRDGNGPALSFTLARSGDRSTYGRIRVTKAGQPKPIFEARGIAVYAEVAQRTVALPIQDAATALSMNGPVKVEYLEEGESGGGTIAEVSAVLR